MSPSLYNGLLLPAGMSHNTYHIKLLDPVCHRRSFHQRRQHMTKFTKLPFCMGTQIVVTFGMLATENCQVIIIGAALFARQLLAFSDVHSHSESKIRSVREECSAVVLTEDSCVQHECSWHRRQCSAVQIADTNLSVHHMQSYKSWLFEMLTRCCCTINSMLHQFVWDISLAAQTTADAGQT